MKKIFLAVLSFFFLGGISAQVLSITAEGDYDFVTEHEGIGIVFDYTEAVVNSIESMEDFIESNRENLEMMDGEKAGKKWEEGWRETLADVQKDFIAVLNDEIGKKSGLKFEDGDETDVIGTFKLLRMDNPHGMGSICEIDAVLTFTNEDGDTLAVEEYNNFQGKPSGMMGIYTMGDGFKLGSCYKTAAAVLGKKLYNLYFDKKKK